MPDTMRSPLIMRGMDELPYEEIASALNIGLSAARMRIKRGREHSRALYEADSTPAGGGDLSRPHSQSAAPNPPARSRRSVHLLLLARAQVIGHPLNFAGQPGLLKAITATHLVLESEGREAMVSNESILDSVARQ